MTKLITCKKCGRQEERSIGYGGGTVPKYCLDCRAEMRERTQRDFYLKKHGKEQPKREYRNGWVYMWLDDLPYDEIGKSSREKSNRYKRIDRHMRDLWGDEWQPKMTF